MSHVHALRERARVLFPSSPRLQSKWVRARLRLMHRKPRVAIGIQVVDTRKFPRSLREAGIHALHETIELPRFVERLVASGRTH